MVLYFVCVSLVVSLSLYFLARHLLQKRIHKNTIAFFHLYCSSGGGGERVLWNAVEAILKNYPRYQIYIYSHKSIHQDALKVLMDVRRTFKIDLVSDPSMVDRLNFIPLRFSPLIEASKYPFLTLFFQSLGSILLAVEAVIKLAPEVYFETIGFTFTLPVFKLNMCSVITYVHYPTISSDMIHNVQTTSHASFNNRQIFVRSPLLRAVKLIYYRMMAYLYGLAGRYSDIVMVNSSWTQSHIDSLWKIKSHVVYPSCGVESFKEVNGSRSSNSKGDSKALDIISVAQFRPEKEHHLQIEAFDLFLSKTKAYGSKLTMYGGCRDDNDRRRVQDLKELIHTLNLGSNIDIVVSAPFERLLAGMRDADVAIHTMKNEHFGIVLLECMAAGLIVVAHSSGGPKMDIIDNGKSGLLADSVADFADCLNRISNMNLKDRDKMRIEASKKADLFTTKKFEEKFIKLVDPILGRNG